MASITIRNLDDALKNRLRVQAARHSRSMEEEAREILRASLAAAEEGPRDLVEAIRRRFAAVGGVDELELPTREPLRDPPKLRR